MRNSNFFDFFGQDSPFERSFYGNSGKLFYSADFLANAVNGTPVTATVAAVASTITSEEKNKTLKTVVIIILLIAIAFLIYQWWLIEKRSKEEMNKYIKPKK